MARREYGGRDNFTESFKMSLKLDRLGITEDELRNMAENPHKKPLMRNLMIFIAVTVLIALFFVFSKYLRNYANTIGGFSYIAVFVSLTRVVTDAVNFFRTKSLKKRQIKLDSKLAA